MSSAENPILEKHAQASAQKIDREREHLGENSPRRYSIDEVNAFLDEVRKSTQGQEFTPSPLFQEKGADREFINSHADQIVDVVMRIEEAVDFFKEENDAEILAQKMVDFKEEIDLKLADLENFNALVEVGDEDARAFVSTELQERKGDWNYVLDEMVLPYISKEQITSFRKQSEEAKQQAEINQKKSEWDAKPDVEKFPFHIFEISKLLKVDIDNLEQKDPKGIKIDFVKLLTSYSSLVRHLENMDDEILAYSYDPEIEDHQRQQVVTVKQKAEQFKILLETKTLKYFTENLSIIFPSIVAIEDARIDPEAEIGNDYEAELTRVTSLLSAMEVQKTNIFGKMVDSGVLIEEMKTKLESVLEANQFITDASKWNERLKEYKDSEDNKKSEEEDFVLVIEGDIKKTDENIGFVFDKELGVSHQHDQVENEYSSIIVQINKIRNLVTERDFVNPVEKNRLLNTMLELELKTLSRKLDHYWKAYDLTINDIEDNNRNSYTTIDDLILPGINNAIKDIRKLNTAHSLAEFARLSSEVDILTSAYKKRKALHFSWLAIRANVIMHDRRTPPEGLSPDNEAVLTGDMAQAIINEGMVANREVGEQNNFVFPQKRKYRRLAWRSDPRLNEDGSPNVKEMIVDGKKVLYVEKEIDETAVGYCMRYFDEIYRGRIKIKDKDVTVSASTIHQSVELVSDHVYEMVNKRARGLLEDAVLPDGWEHDEVAKKGIFVPMSVVRKAFRLSAIFTLNQSFLPRGASVGTSDEIFYAMKWGTYSEEYAKTQKASFSHLVTDLLFGPPGINPLETRTPNKIADMERDLRAKGFLTPDPELEAKRGYTDFSFLLSPPLYPNKNRAVSYKPNKDKGAKTISERTVGGRIIVEALDASGHVVPDGVVYTFDSPVIANPARRLVKQAEGVVVDPRTREERKERMALAFLTAQDFEKTDPGTGLPIDYTKNPAAGSGIYVTFDDVKAFGEWGNPPSPKDGERYFGTDSLLGDEIAYEDAGWDERTEKVLFDYYAKFASGPYQLLLKVLRAKDSEVMGTLDSPEGVSGLRTTAYYASMYMTRVGPSISVESKIKSKFTGDFLDKSVIDKANMQAHKMMVMLIFAKCLHMSDEYRKAGDRWDPNDVLSYLLKLVRGHALLPIEAKAIYTAYKAGEMKKRFAQAIWDRVDQEVENLGKFT